MAVKTKTNGANTLSLCSYSMLYGSQILGSSMKPKLYLPYNTFGTPYTVMLYHTPLWLTMQSISL